MIPLLLSFTFAIAVLLIYEGLTNPRPSGRRRPRLLAMEEFLVRAGLRDVTPRDFLLFSLAAGLASGALAHLLLGWALVTLLAAGSGAAAPFVYYTHRHDRRRAALQGALAEAIAQLRDAIRTGLAVQEALAALARTGPDALRPDLALLVREMRLLGFAPAMHNLRERLADPLFDVVAATLLLNDRLGGRNVGQVLDRLAQAPRALLEVDKLVHHGTIKLWRGLYLLA